MTTFAYTGAVQYFEVPADVIALEIKTWGAQGQNTGGLGGYATGVLAVTPGETVNVYVGGTAGYNGGGAPAPGGAYHGGGASDVRQGGAALADRKIVAGGGGGTFGGSPGGAGGGAVGSDSADGGGSGGTQSAGGAGSVPDGNAGSLGTGGSAAIAGPAGGGGGYYGGGSGGDGYTHGSGGGGSGYTGGVTSASMSSGVRSGNGQITITVANVAPNAPTLTHPTGGETLAVEPSQTFTWTFSDDNVGDHQSAYDLRYRVIGAADWTTAPSATVSGTTAQLRTFAANTFTDATDYEWQCRTYDALGAVGPYSASALFSAAATPGAPTIDDPANGGTIAAATDNVDWTIANQAAYQLRTVADDAGAPNTATVYTDTGTQTTAVARTANVAFATNNRYEHIQVRIYHGALWGPWASIRVLVAYTVPMTPTVVVATSDAGGYISLTPTQPTPEGSAPVVAWYDVYRREAGGAAIRIAKEQPPTAVYLDYQVASGVDYVYFIRAIGSTGTSADSAETA